VQTNVFDGSSVSDCLRPRRVVELELEFDGSGDSCDGEDMVLAEFD